jgi:lysophospholipase L1-like esterase/phosphoserine phosphatase
MSDQGRDESLQSSAGGPGKQSPTSAVAIPLVALGLLAAAVWLGSQPASLPVPAAAVATPAAAVDPLPSWNDGATKRAILDFVATVTREGAAGFVPPAERIAVFDHDGTLVCEKPVVHGMFLIDRIRELVERQPELAHEEPYATILTGDLEFVRRLGKKFFTELTFSALGGVPEERLEAEARDFIRTARHPAFDVPLGDVTYQPMKELIALLRAKGFSVWICSGSGIHFMRPAAAEWYGIPPEHVIASRPLTELREVEPATTENEKSPNTRLDLVVLPEVHVLNDEERKPVSIGEHIGRRPILAVGNVGTTGDIEMLRWSQSGHRPSLQLLVLHDDAEREMAYGEPRNESLDAAAKYGWQVVRMASDWKRVFAKPLSRKAPEPPATIAPPASPPSSVPAVVPAAAPVPPAAAAPALPPTAVGPPPTDWPAVLASRAELDGTSPPEPGGVCLVGSSNISLWTTLADDFTGMNVANRGVAGCRLAELAEHVGPLVAAAKPRIVAVSAGANDVAAGGSAADVRAAFERLVANVRRDHPEAAIVFLSLMPSIKRWEQWGRQQEANAAVREFIEAAGPEAGLSYVDVSAAFLGADGGPAEECLLDDLLHPSTIGNARRAEIVRPVLRKLLGE